MAEKLRQAVETWVKAEFAFRFGPKRYSHLTQKLYITAEQNLREALTGVGTIRGSAEKLGINIDDDYVRENTPKAKKKKVKKKVKKPVKPKRPKPLESYESDTGFSVVDDILGDL